MKGKRGMEIEEIGKIIIALVILALLIGAVILLFSGRGSQVLDAIKNLLRFGRP